MSNYLGGLTGKAQPFRGVLRQSREFVPEIFPIINSAAYLIELALRGLLIGPPAQEFCPVTKAAAGEVIVLNFDDELWRERLPLGGALGGPAAWTTGRVAGEARRLDQLFQLL